MEGRTNKGEFPLVYPRTNKGLGPLFIPCFARAVKAQRRPMPPIMPPAPNMATVIIPITKPMTIAIATVTAV
jgi:hypothetical protein